jgi:capsule polysaccharide export protein KpsC/LpsZ
LVLAQCEADYSVKRHDFGDYVTRINAVVDEILNCSDKKVIVKAHPHCRLSIFNDDKRIKIVRGKYSAHELIKNSYCVVVANSGSGFEALFHDKPVICWSLPEYHWVSYDLRHLCDMKRALKLDWYKPKSVILFLYWYFEHYCFFDSESAAKRVKNLLDIEQKMS